MSSGDSDAFEKTEAVPSTVQAEGPLSSGTQLGRYEIVRPLGQGGMGIVYEGFHRELKKRVAIKTLHAQIAGAAVIRTRFLREGQAASRVRHEHVVDVYDVGVEGEVPYLVMEYLEGESLRDLLTRVGRLSGTELADIAVPLIAGLAVAHDEGIVHRDLKPENVYLETTPAGRRPKLLDFGISKVADDAGGHALTATSSLLGTPFYMSPEQAKDARVCDARSDQYSFGAMLYEAAAGRRPFDEQSLYSLLDSIVAGRFPPPTELEGSIPKELEAIILRAMARVPSDRFETMRTLGRHLLPLASPRTRVLFEGALDEGATGSSLAAPTPPGAPPPASHHAITAAGSVSTLAEASRDVARPRSKLMPLVAVGGALAIAAFLALRPTGEAPLPAVEEPRPTVNPVVAPATAAPVVTPVPPQPAAAITRRVESEPSGAEVSRDGTVIGKTPLDIELGPGEPEVALEVRAPGHVAATLRLTRAAPTPPVTLTRTAARPSKGGAPKAPSPAKGAVPPPLAPR